MAKVRAQTTPTMPGRRRWAGCTRHGLVLSLAVAAGIALFLALAAVMVGGLFHEPLAGNFYAVFPHNTLALMFGLVFGYAVFALGMGVARFWRDVSPAPPARGGGRGRARRAAPALPGRRARQGCNNADDAFTLWRRRFHHCTFYGFMLCFAATCVATLYHYFLGEPAPYPFWSAPVLLGTVGGVGLLVARPACCG